MKTCRLCKSILDQQVITMTVPAGTQLFTSNVGASEKLRTKLEIIQTSHYMR